MTRNSNIVVSLSSTPHISTLKPINHFGWWWSGLDTGDNIGGRQCWHYIWAKVDSIPTLFWNLYCAIMTFIEVTKQRKLQIGCQFLWYLENNHVFAPSYSLPYAMQKKSNTIFLKVVFGWSNCKLLRNSKLIKLGIPSSKISRNKNHIFWITHQRSLYICLYMVR